MVKGRHFSNSLYNTDRYRASKGSTLFSIDVGPLLFALAVISSSSAFYPSFNNNLKLFSIFLKGSTR